MAEVDFWEKPGCINNTRQKQLLREAGHLVREHNLLTEAWASERLRAFFGELPVAEWFNRSAPAIKEGRVVPEGLGEAEALALMIQDPLLIRRPLMQVGDQRRVGFDAAAMDLWIGLAPKAAQGNADLETCPRSHQDSLNPLPPGEGRVRAGVCGDSGVVQQAFSSTGPHPNPSPARRGANAEGVGP